jgi:hypothetical protein
MVRSMYCPRCEKSIKKERLEELSKELKSKFGSSSLDQGACPVCGTVLLDPERKKVQ